MKKKAFWTGLGLAGLILAGTATAWAEGRIPCRQAEQGRRIAAGIRCGQISPGEYDRLRREQCQIRQVKRFVRADVCLDPWKRDHIRRLQVRAGAHIYRTRHSGTACGARRRLGERSCCLYGENPRLASGRMSLCTPLAAHSKLSMHWSW